MVAVGRALNLGHAALANAGAVQNHEPSACQRRDQVLIAETSLDRLDGLVGGEHRGPLVVPELADFHMGLSQVVELFAVLLLAGQGDDAVAELLGHGYDVLLALGMHARQSFLAVVVGALFGRSGTRREHDPIGRVLKGRGDHLRELGGLVELLDLDGARGRERTPTHALDRRDPDPALLGRLRELQNRGAGLVVDGERRLRGLQQDLAVFGDAQTSHAPVVVGIGIHLTGEKLRQVIDMSELLGSDPNDLILQSVAPCSFSSSLLFIGKALFR